MRQKKKIFVSGAVRDVYPLRQFILNYQEYIDVLNHPGYQNNENKLIDEKYYRKLSEYLCCFTDASKYKYVLLKVFEICSVGSLLLCDDLIEIELYKMGFKSNINYISCNKDNLQSKIEWILDKENRPEVNKIRLNGMKLVRKYHNTLERAKSFNNIIMSMTSTSFNKEAPPSSLPSSTASLRNSNWKKSNSQVRMIFTNPAENKYEKVI